MNQREKLKSKMWKRNSLLPLLNIEVHQKVELQDADMYLMNNDKPLRTYVQNLMIYFQLIPVI